jgi:hypothetical protein
LYLFYFVLLIVLNIFGKIYFNEISSNEYFKPHSRSKKSNSSKNKKNIELFNEISKRIVRKKKSKYKEDFFQNFRGRICSPKKSLLFSASLLCFPSKKNGQMKDVKEIKYYDDFDLDEYVFEDGDREKKKYEHTLQLENGEIENGKNEDV